MRYASIAYRRFGIYLVNVGESDSGDEKWDAFGSLKAAKDYVRFELGLGPKVRWEVDALAPDTRRWYIEVEDE